MPTLSRLEIALRKLHVHRIGQALKHSSTAFTNTTPVVVAEAATAATHASARSQTGGCTTVAPPPHALPTWGPHDLWLPSPPCVRRRTARNPQRVALRAPSVVLHLYKPRRPPSARRLGQRAVCVVRALRRPRTPSLLGGRHGASSRSRRAPHKHLASTVSHGHGCAHIATATHNRWNLSISPTKGAVGACVHELRLYDGRCDQLRSSWSNRRPFGHPFPNKSSINAWMLVERGSLTPERPGLWASAEVGHQKVVYEVRTLLGGKWRFGPTKVKWEDRHRYVNSSCDGPTNLGHACGKLNANLCTCP